jgi:hypothetical protein
MQLGVQDSFVYCAQVSDYSVRGTEDGGFSKEDSYDSWNPIGNEWARYSVSARRYSILSLESVTLPGLCETLDGMFHMPFDAAARPLSADFDEVDVS